MRLNIGTSTLADPAAALASAAKDALAASKSPVLAFVFATYEYAPAEVASAANRELDALPWAGAITPAILVSPRALPRATACIVPRGLAVGVIDCARMRVRIGTSSCTSSDWREAGRRAARDALVGMPLPPADRSRAMFLFADTDSCDAAEALHGAVSVAGAGIAWSGGGTGASEAGVVSARFAHGRGVDEHVVAVTLDCHSRVGIGMKHGWQPTGAPAMVTQANGCMLERLEHRPAFEIYRAAAEERGERVDDHHFAAFAMTHPLGIPQADGEYLIRDPIATDASGALRFMASVPDGALVRVMEGTPEMLVQAARVAAKAARDDAGAPLGGALVFDCVSRYLMLRDRLSDEVAACQTALGDDVPVLGCLTFGEVGAFGARMPQFHNKSMVVVALPA
jgi:hypothetical protein